MNAAIWNALGVMLRSGRDDPPAPEREGSDSEGDVLAEVIARCAKDGVITARALVQAGIPLEPGVTVWLREGLERLGWKRANNADAFVAPGVCPTLETSP